MITYFKVGGCIRDSLLGLESKDIDYTCCLEDCSITCEEGFELLERDLISKGYEIYLTTPECFTIRAKNTGKSKEVADFVLSRKELGYNSDSRKPILSLGNLEDDLKRRDFTVNALAEDSDGNIIDLFNGLEHLKKKVLVTPLDPLVTFTDDPLRVLRGWRFSITKDFEIDQTVWEAMFNEEVLLKLKTTVSSERIREELYKCFKVDTLKTIRFLNKIDQKSSEHLDSLFSSNLWLLPTFKDR